MSRTNALNLSSTLARFVVALGTAALLFGVLVSPSVAEEVRRTWTSRGGKHKIEADFVRLDKDEVVLKQVKDGKIIKVKLINLSAPDIRAAEKLSREVVEENPFVESGEGDNESAPTPTASSDGNGFIESPGRDSVEKTLLVNTDDWTYKPDLEPVVDLKLKATIPLAKPKRQETDAETKRLSNHDGLDNGHFVWTRGEYIALLRNPFLDKPDKRKGPLFVRYDLTTGKAKGFKKLTFSTTPRFVSPDGKLIIGWDEHDRDKLDLHVMSIGDDGGLKMQYRWLPLVKDEHWDYQNELRFVGGDRIAVRSTKGDIDVWQVTPDTASLLFTIATEPHGSAWAVSRGGKYLAVTQKDNVFLVDTSDGKVAGKLSGGEQHTNTVSFSPDGKQLAVATPAIVKVFDLESRAMTGSVRFQNPINPQTIEFPAPDFVFINGSHLINVPLSVVAWEYTGHFGHHQPQWHGGSFWHRTAVAGNDVITQLKLPHAAALASVKGFNDSMYVLKPGTQVALVVNENGPERDEIIRGVTENLKKVGVDVVASANMAFICETEMGKSKTVPYRLFGGGEQSVTVTEKTHRIRLMEGQNKVWEGANFHSAPFFINLQQGETVDQHVAKTMNTSKFYFLGINIPDKIVRYPAGQNSLGKSELTAGGP